MEILLDNPLAAMYGPYFLIFYGFFITFTLITLGIIKTRIDKTDEIGLPPIPAQIDPYEIAYMRGGTNEVARSVIFSLMQKGFLEINREGSKTYLSRTNNQTDATRLLPIEQLALEWVKTRQETKRVFEGNGLTTQLRTYGLSYQARLEQQQLLVGDELKSQMSRWKWIAVAAIFGLGAYKIFASLVYGIYNFIGLIVMGVIGLVIALSIANLPRITKLGKAYLERLQLAFDSLKYEAQKNYIPSNEPRPVQQTTFAGVDPLLLSVGVFGGGILAGTMFDEYNQTFQRAQNQSANSGSCGSACGSSCSSSDGGGSSCSSGSSCGSSCGGGCGGCGS